MASVAPLTQYDPLQPVHKLDITPDSMTSSEPAAKRLNLSTPTGPQTIPRPPYSPDDSMKGYSNPFANWNSYSMNANVYPNCSNQNTMPSPPSTASFNTPQSSTTSSPAEPLANSHAQSPTTSSYFNSQGFKRPRSKSFAIPTPTSCCPNCGLRRPSVIADQTLSHTHSPTSLPMTTKFPPLHRPHLPLHLHCPDFCPDDHFPTKSASTSTLASPLQKQRHHRRRSSLCYAESLIEDAEVIDNGGVPVDVKLGWERQAESIARNVVLRKAGLDGFKIVEEEAIED